MISGLNVSVTHAGITAGGLPLGNHGLWLAFTVFMAARALPLGAANPRLERAVES